MTIKGITKQIEKLEIKSKKVLQSVDYDYANYKYNLVIKQLDINRRALKHLERASELLSWI